MILSINLNDQASPQVAAFASRLRSRRPLHQAIGTRVKALTRDYVIREAGLRHDTAEQLGARPSNFVSAAAESVERGTPLADNEGVSIALPHPYFARAFGDVTIAPKSGLYLTIPMIAQAYNQRAYRVQGLFFLKSKKTGKAFLAESIRAPGVKAKLKLWYSLVPSVFQRQDRSRLPTDESILSSALAGIRDYVAFLLKKKGGPPGGQ
jgi:hypothetical protein